FQRAPNPGAASDDDASNDSPDPGSARFQRAKNPGAASDDDASNDSPDPGSARFQRAKNPGAANAADLAPIGSARNENVPEPPTESTPEACGDSPQTVKRFSIDFPTPLRLKSNGEYLRGHIPFAVLMGALIRRLETLSFFYCGGSLELDYRALMEKAAEVEIQFADLRWVEWQRYSRRQDRRIPWAGAVGTVHYEGDVEPFLPFLVLGEIVGVGNNCAFGLGRLFVTHES
ncbi:MAG: CRISPR system precrRNA processing endoribonuclease RAMP protein Cas6, partial [Blastocatellia bacterium]